MRFKKHSRLKKSLLIFLVIAAAFFVYIEVVNRNSYHMTYRQKFLKAVYPIWMWFSGTKNKTSKSLSGKKTAAPVSFYSLTGTLNDGTTVDLASFKGKKIMLVNTASNCGFTDQYSDLQKLSVEFKDRLTVIGFPANDFKEQEKGSDDEIAAFCKSNFHISFPLMKKSSVVRGAAQNPIFDWLTDPAKNGWNDQQPTWNFCKYLVDENGTLLNFFAPGISPYDKQVINAINQ